MKSLRLLGFWLLFFAATARGADDLLDRLDDVLTVSAFDDEVRARLSGLMDLEYYHFHQPAPGLIESKSNNLFNPRLTLFLDVQLGPHVYLFAESRVDRGFDPSDENGQMRLDEYALRITPWDDGRFNFQVGKFSTVVGDWVERHLSWENPLITAPLPYEDPSAIYSERAPASVQDFLKRRYFKYGGSLPLIWGPDYGSGASISGKLGHFEYAAEIKNTAVSSPPYVWDFTNTGFSHPTVNARLGWRPDESWNFGISGSDSPYLDSMAVSSLPRGTGLGDFHEKLLGQDISFAWHHWQLWAEVYETRFEVPRVGNADTVAYYLEAKYKFTPEIFGALRWNQQFFGDVSNGYGGETPWGNDLWRIDAALGWRLTAHTQLKLQYSLQHEDGNGPNFSNILAAQFTVRF